MSMTDPIADFLTRIRNALSARKVVVEAPASKMKMHIAEVLKREGYIKHYSLKEDGAWKTIVVELKYNNDNTPAIEGIKRVSRPGQRIYVGTEEIPKVRGGLGIAIITTSKGVMTDREARRQHIGGEVVCYVW